MVAYRRRSWWLLAAVMLVAGTVVAGIIYLTQNRNTTTTDPLASYGVVQVVVTDTAGIRHTWCLLRADTDALREQGLMGVTDSRLNGHPGMLFIFPDTTQLPFWMKDTPLALSLAYFSTNGALESTVDMPACGNSNSCPNYPPQKQYQYALEVPLGQLSRLGIQSGSNLKIVTDSCSTSN